MTAYVGEIRLFAGNFAPNGWAFCDGSTVPIAENETLFQLIGTTYGGDGQVTFNLPDLQGRVPVHAGTGPQGQTFQLGERAGTEAETLSVQQMPNHVHPFVAATGGATTANAANNLLAQTPSYTPYISEATNAALAPGTVTPSGGSQPHSNMQPYLGINFIISLFGVFPSQT